MKTNILTQTDTKTYKLTSIDVYRWKDYIGDLPSPLCPTSKKVMRILGQVPGDGNVYDHHRHQARLVRNYGRRDIGDSSLVESGILWHFPLSHMDHFQLRVAGLTHDLGETAPEIGDTCYDKKHLVNHTKQEEFEAGASVIASVVKHPEQHRFAVDCYAIDFDEQHRLYKIFKMYEKLSYVSGAIHAVKTAGSEAQIARPAHLVHNVLKNQIATLIYWYSKNIPSIIAFIDEHRIEINNLFLFVVSSKFVDEHDENNKKFDEAQTLWFSFWERK